MPNRKELEKAKKKNNNIKKKWLEKQKKSLGLKV